MLQMFCSLLSDALLLGLGKLQPDYAVAVGVQGVDCTVLRVHDEDSGLTWWIQVLKFLFFPACLLHLLHMIILPLVFYKLCMLPTVYPSPLVDLRLAFCTLVDICILVNFSSPQSTNPSVAQISSANPASWKMCLDIVSYFLK